MKKILYFLFLIPSFLLGGLVNDASEEDELEVNRHTLKIYNSTHIDEGGPGRDLFLIWTNDVHQPPQITQWLKQGQFDSRKSRGMGFGGNRRTFTIEVYRLLKGNKLKVGKFDHDFDTPAPAGGGRMEISNIIKICTKDRVDLYVENFSQDRHPLEPIERIFIGSVPLSKW